MTGPLLRLHVSALKAAYRGNYARLARVKDRYDPQNIFHINQNIQPASGPGE